MTTASTKSRAGKKGKRAAPPPKLSAFESFLAGERGWWLACGAVMALAAAFRFYELALRPAHHDEGVNGFFLTNLFRNGVYKYDPANYHGPALYYITLPFVYLFGLNTVAIRLVTVAFGLGTIALVLCLRKRIGAAGALSAALLLAVSPGAVFFSRYYIHEMLFVFFSLAIVVAALEYYDTARPDYLFLAVASAALLFATKETAMITAGVLLIAWMLTEVYSRVLPENFLSVFGHGRKAVAGPGGAGPSFFERAGGHNQLIILAAVALLFFLAINVLFYSSFFTYKAGLNGAIETFKIWTKTGMSEFHRKPMDTYIQWLWKEEAPLFIFSALGCAAAFLLPGKKFGVFNAAVLIGLVLAYSLIAYKTPWLDLNFIVPMAVAAGFGFGVVWEWANSSSVKFILVLVLLAGVYVSVGRAYQMNFVEYDKDSYTYIYAHTRRGFHDMFDEIERLARQNGSGYTTSIAVMSPDYWPMPWYFRDYKNVGYWTRVNPSTDPIIVAAETQEREVQPIVAGGYKRMGIYDLRPGVRLILWARNDVAAKAAR